MTNKIKMLGTLCVMTLIGSASCSHKDGEKHAFTGVIATEINDDMAFNYFPDNDMMSVRTIEIVPDSIGRFVFPDSLITGNDLHSQILVGNDYFGIYMEKGKSVEGTLSKAIDGRLQITFEGDNADINTYYNALCQAFDSMKYFSPDPENASPLSEYFALLESENEKVKGMSDIVKDPEKRAYYEKMRDRMYTWSKIRLIMDQAYEEGKKESEYPEYVELVNTIDPNDDMSLMCTLIFPWINSQAKSDPQDGLAHGIESLHIVDQKITNPNTRKVMFNQLPYFFFAYSQPTPEQAEAYMQEYSKLASDYPELVENYNLRAAAIKPVVAGQALPYDPELETPTSEKLKLSDLFGKVLYIDLWATWCGPCCKEIPHMEKLVEKMKNNNDVVFVSISSDADKQAWLDKIAKDKPEWAQYIFTPESNEKFFTSLNITGIPRFMILNADGTIAVPDADRPSNPNVEAQILSCVK